MLKFTLLLIIFVISFCAQQSESATFEDVNGFVTKRIRIRGCLIGIRPEPPKKSFFIKSDNSLLPYVKDEDTLNIIAIHNQKISKLPVDSIKDLVKIEGLEIKSSGLKKLEPGAFNNVPKLNEVDLGGNELEEIKNGVFTGLEITSLRLDNNKITTIEDKAFNNMKLSSIYMQHNKISNWNNNWFTGSPVTYIFMGKNLIQELPENSFNFIKHHENVNADNKKPILADDCSSNRQTRRSSILYFEENKIKTIHPGAFNGVGDVSELNLRDNEIVELTNGVFDGISYVSTLRLANNKISKITDQLFGNTKVQTADLDDNKLSDFPLNLLKSKQVFYVLMRNNPLKCSYIKEVENWRSNKNDDYDRGLYEFPFGPEFENLKSNCV